MYRARTRLCFCLLFAALPFTTSCTLGTLEPDWRQQQDTVRVSRPPKTLTTEQARPIMAAVAR